jgi:hypothetical protein
MVGSLEFLVPRCILHTHSSVPYNAAIQEYFTLDEMSRGALLKQANGTYERDRSITRSLQLLQSLGCLQIKWDVHHCERELSESVTKKLEILKTHRPVTFDLSRKFTPPCTYRNASMTFPNKPAQAEGNDEFWNCMCELTCIAPVSSFQSPPKKLLPSAPPLLLLTPQVRRECVRNHRCNQLTAAIVPSPVLPMAVTLS